MCTCTDVCGKRYTTQEATSRSSRNMLTEENLTGALCTHVQPSARGKGGKASGAGASEDAVMEALDVAGAAPGAADDTAAEPASPARPAKPAPAKPPVPAAFQASAAPGQETRRVLRKVQQTDYNDKGEEVVVEVEEWVEVPVGAGSPPAQSTVQAAAKQAAPAAKPGPAAGGKASGGAASGGAKGSGKVGCRQAGRGAARACWWMAGAAACALATLHCIHRRI